MTDPKWPLAIPAEPCPVNRVLPSPISSGSLLTKCQQIKWAKKVLMSKTVWLPEHPLVDCSMAGHQTKSEYPGDFCGEGGQNSFVPHGLIKSNAQINTGPHSVWPREGDGDGKVGAMSNGFYSLWSTHYCRVLRQVASDADMADTI